MGPASPANWARVGSDGGSTAGVEEGWLSVGLVRALAGGAVVGMPGLPGIAAGTSSLVVETGA